MCFRLGHRYLSSLAAVVKGWQCSRREGTGQKDRGGCGCINHQLCTQHDVHVATRSKIRNEREENSRWSHTGCLFIGTPALEWQEGVHRIPGHMKVNVDLSGSDLVRSRAWHGMRSIKRAQLQAMIGRARGVPHGGRCHTLRDAKAPHLALEHLHGMLCRYKAQAPAEHVGDQSITSSAASLPIYLSPCTWEGLQPGPLACFVDVIVIPIMSLKQHPVWHHV